MKKLYLLLFSIFTLFIPLSGVNAADANVENISTFTELKSVRQGLVLEPTIQKEKITNRWIITIDYKDVIYKLTTSKLPHDDYEEMQKKYNGIAPRSMKFWTDEDGKTYLWYDFQNNPADGQIFAELNGEIKGFRPFVLYNITDSKVNITAKLIIPGITQIFKDNIYFDIIFPMNLDNLIQITMVYTTKTQKLWISGKEVTHSVVRINGQHEFVKTFNHSGLFAISTYASRDHIQDITSTFDSEQSKDSYMQKLNNGLKKSSLNPMENKSDVFKDEYSAYRIFGSQEKSLFQTGLSVSDISITEVLYEYKGEFFHVPEQDIESYIGGATIGGNVLNGINLNFEKIEYLILLFFGGMFMLQLLRDKKLARFLLFVAGAVAVVYVFLK